jgi:AcrR family transcriptional regulator
VRAKISRKPVRIRNPRQTRARLLHATVGLLARRGVDGLSVKEVARVANVSRGVAYQHFRDRDHLMREAKAWISGQLLESSRAARPSSMEEQVGSIARLVMSNRDAANLFLADAVAGRVLADDHPLRQLLGQMHHELEASGEARKGIDVEVFSCIMLGAVASMLMLSHRVRGNDVDSAASRFGREFSLLLRQGIFAPRSRHHRAPKVT